MKPTKYKVKSFCALYERGEIIDAFVLFSDEPKALIYLPPNEDDASCGCLILCKKDNRHKREVWVELSEDSYINLTNKDNQLLQTSFQNRKKKK